MSRLVWHGLTQSELDRQYSPSTTVADINEWLDAYAVASAIARRRLANVLNVDVPYGPDPAQRLDIVRTSRTGAPFVVYFHGGFWQELDKRDSLFAAEALQAAGIGLVAVGYRRAPAARLSQIVSDARAAVRWIGQHIDEYGGTAQRLIVAGHSAGAHLAAMLVAAEPGVAPEEPQLAGAVLMGGVYDLEPVRLSYVNAALAMSQAEARDNSPLLRRPRPVPTLLVSAERETDEFAWQSAALAQAWRADLPCQTFTQPGRHHFDSPLELGEPSTRLYTETCRLAHQSGSS